MRDFYKKMLEQSIDDVDEISRSLETNTNKSGRGIESRDEMAMQLFQMRIQRYHMKARQSDMEFPEEHEGMYE